MPRSAVMGSSKQSPAHFLPAQQPKRSQPALGGASHSPSVATEVHGAWGILRGAVRSNLATLYRDALSTFGQAVAVVVDANPLDG